MLVAFAYTARELGWYRPQFVEKDVLKIKEGFKRSFKNIRLQEASEHTHSEDAVQEVQWVEVADPQSGRKYYYNPATNETRWDVPRSIRIHNETMQGGSTRPMGFKQWL